MSQRIIIGISGASGVVYGIRMLEVLRRDPDVETHLVMTAAGRATISQETAWSVKDVEALASVVHSPANIGASIASGSFEVKAMLVAPCSVRALSAVANCYNADLLARAADVQLKEGRPVVLLVRETPLHAGHIRLMQQAVENGAIVMPPVPAFYGHPKTIDDVVNHTVGRALARAGIENELFFRWLGMGRPTANEE